MKTKCELRRRNHGKRNSQRDDHWRAHHDWRSCRTISVLQCVYHRFINLPLPDSQKPDWEVCRPIAHKYLGTRHDRAVCDQRSHSRSVNFPVDRIRSRQQWISHQPWGIYVCLRFDAHVLRHGCNEHFPPVKGSCSSTKTTTFFGEVSFGEHGALLLDGSLGGPLTNRSLVLFLFLF